MTHRQFTMRPSRRLRRAAGVFLLAAVPFLAAHGEDWFPITLADGPAPAVEADPTTLERFADLRWVKVRIVPSDGDPTAGFVVVDCRTGDLGWLGGVPGDRPAIPPTPSERLARAACSSPASKR